MQVTFLPTGEVMNTDLATAQRGPTSPVLTQPVIGGGGIGAFGGQLTGGSLQWQVGGSGGNYIVWKQGATEVTNALWLMDSEAAVANGLDTIADQLNAGTAAITLWADGSNGS